MLDLVSADTAANLVADVSMRAGWMDRTTAAQIDRDFGAAATQRVSTRRGGAPPLISLAESEGLSILVVGAVLGILGTGFAEAILDLDAVRVPRPEIEVLAAEVGSDRVTRYGRAPGRPGVRIEHLVPGFGLPGVGGGDPDPDRGPGSPSTASGTRTVVGSYCESFVRANGIGGGRAAQDLRNASATRSRICRHDVVDQERRHA